VAATSLREILRRFRLHNVPGAPAATGVPVDRTAELDSELEPVFSALEGAQRHAADLVEAATRAAASRRSDAVEKGRRLVAEAHARTGPARAEAASALLARADGERTRLLAAARMEVERIGLVTGERSPALVDEVVRRVLSLPGPLP
jgi:vacuolar-type H+-ATPase subunit H